MNTSNSLIFDDRLQEQASSTDFFDLLLDKMNGLYLLSFLVTANTHIAEMCFSKALDEYVETSGGFLDWARQDGRCAVLDHAVRLIRPHPKQTCSSVYLGYPRRQAAAAYQPFSAITSLSSFVRFIFVMSVIECLSDDECAALLNCSVQDVAIGLRLAREIIQEEDISDDLTGEMDLYSGPSLPGHQHWGYLLRHN